jgi:polar amino acid transport system substrate-binding protein
MLAGSISVFESQAQGNRPRTVRLATEGAFPPFNYVDPDGKLTGFDVDLGRALCAKAKLNCAFVTREWDALIPGLVARDYDAVIASMAITPERKKVVAFGDSYYVAPLAFAAKKGSGIDDTSPLALKGKIVGAQAGTVMADFLGEKYGDGVRLKFYRTQGEANRDLAAGRVDLVLGEKFALYDWIQADSTDFEFVGEDYREPRLSGAGVGIAFRREDARLRTLFNRALGELRADGTYQAIGRKYFPFPIE